MQLLLPAYSQIQGYSTFPDKVIPSVKNLLFLSASTASSYSLIKSGEKVAISGKNGVGKTTLLKTLLGLIPALDGSIFFQIR